MKRSEMLQILEESIDNNYDYSIDKGVAYSYDAILKDLEKAGMLPPAYRKSGISVHRYDDDGTLGHTEYPIIKCGCHLAGPTWPSYGASSNP